MATTSPPPPHAYFADLYTFDWSKLSLREPLISVASVAFFLIGGVLIGHPSAGLIAGGGAMTVGFGVNQRIGDSRLWPMIGATLVMCVSTFVGMIAGHNGYALLFTATLWGLNYGLLTSLAPGISWVGQQAAVTLFVCSAFPANPHDALLRSLLTLLGGAVQILVTSVFLHLLPELQTDLLGLPKATQESIAYLYRAAPHPQPPPDPMQFPTFRGIRARYHLWHHRLPHLRGIPTFTYAVRLALTVLAAAETYRRLGMQSGYWVPMTALLVQKPAFAETFNRALMRIAGTLAGAGLATFALAHMHPQPLYLAIGATFFATVGFCTVNVNYGIFSVFLTTYIVFLLSLNQLPGPVIAHRRAACTIAGGLIALAFHVDSLRRQKSALPTG
ncbi:FUSC family protein [Granulicella sibirica]|uniref:Integral membrane bound transporter domain-containing protein n=1 Tax=Granulicella sibirica TaxID=2479048 RepID=A0A4Q0SWN9_9BACT|nr:FUSC family protein [Granulicella sibirica]RXH55207.1 hypothetical protein GRAN_4311 [Granulicella sibirica]